MKIDPRAELERAVQKAAAQLEVLGQEASGDAALAVSAAQAMLSQASGGSPQALSALAEELEDPAARAWLSALVSQDEGALPALKELHALGREYAALGLAERRVRELRRSEPEAAISLGDAALSWSWGAQVEAQRAQLEVTVAETALLSGAEDGAERMRAAMHRAELKQQWRARFQGVMAMSMASQAAGLLSEAGRQADVARALAVTARDPSRYLVSMKRLMELAELAGDHLGAYGVALRAGASLEKLQGAAGARLGEQLLAGLRERWGDSDYDRVRAEWLKVHDVRP